MKHLLTTLILIFPPACYAQIGGDSLLSTPQTRIEVSIAIDDLNLLSSTNDSLTRSLVELKQKYDKLYIQDSINSIKLSRLENDKAILTKDKEDLLANQTEANKRLINTASNFLYIPYDAFSIDKIAIPAFNAVSDKVLQHNHQYKYTLLKNFKSDLEKLAQFIDYIETELNKPFTKNATEMLEAFCNEPYYVAYHKYNNWENTYLGKKMVIIENQLKSFNGADKKINLNTLKSELLVCLKTAENL